MPMLDHLDLVRRAGPLVERGVGEGQHHLRREVVREGRDDDPVPLEHLLDVARVARVLLRAVGVEVVRAAPGRQLEGLVAEPGGVRRDLLQRLVVEDDRQQPDLHALSPMSSPSSGAWLRPASSRGSNTTFTRLPARRSPNARSHASSGTTSLTSPSSATARERISPRARRQERGVDANPEVDHELLREDVVERHRHRPAEHADLHVPRRRGPPPPGTPSPRRPTPEHSMTTSKPSPSSGAACAVSRPRPLRASPAAPRRTAGRCTSTSPPSARATCAASRPIGPGPGDQHPVAGGDGRRVAQALADARQRLGQRRRVVVEPVRHAVQAVRRHHHPRARTRRRRTSRSSAAPGTGSCARRGRSGTRRRSSSTSRRRRARRPAPRRRRRRRPPRRRRPRAPS